GTLDPMATGVLVLGINRATRLLGHLMLTEKEYEATVRLGVTTVTDDAEGDETSRTSARHVTEADVRLALEAFVGEIQQVPSAVSAIKVDGKRSYARVRAGEEVTLKARAVTVSVLEVGDVRPVGDLVDVDIRVVCSSGTYIRAIARDLGAALGVGGHLTALRRTRVGMFGLDDAHTLDQLESELAIVPIDDAARRTFMPYTLTEEQAERVRHGRSIADVVLPSEGVPHAMFAPDGEFLALYEQDVGAIKALAVFAER
ncbi:MAG: tRNA pseudouridine(55) synthase TruB, partial [Nocardioidaceae bacterium]|nr:tRNA pseudouridine(55) synthase TruB [Nocardioidaceae bacterium]